jgi:hypothetical protein
MTKETWQQIQFVLWKGYHLADDGGPAVTLLYLLAKSTDHLIERMEEDEAEKPRVDFYPGMGAPSSEELTNAELKKTICGHDSYAAVVLKNGATVEICETCGERSRP